MKPDIIVVLWRIEELLPELDKNLNLPKNKFNNYFKIIKQEFNQKFFSNI